MKEQSTRTTPEIWQTKFEKFIEKTSGRKLTPTEEYQYRFFITMLSDENILGDNESRE